MLSACVDESEDVSTATQDLALGNVSNSIVVKNGTLCMVAPLAGIGPVTQQTCQSTGTHWWKIVRSLAEPNYYYIENNNGSGRCLEVPAVAGSASASGLDLQVNNCHRQSNQLFAVIKTAEGEWRIQPKLGVLSNLCLDIEGGGTNLGARLQQYTCKTIDVENQRFFAVPQQQEPTFVSCPSAVALQVKPFSGEEVILYQTGIVNFSGAGFGYRCYTSGTPPLQTHSSCPAGTNLMEISRNYPDQFRVKCGRS